MTASYPTVDEGYIINTEKFPLGYQSVRLHLSLQRVTHENKSAVVVESAYSFPGYITKTAYFPLHRMPEALDHHQSLTKAWKAFMAAKDNSLEFPEFVCAYTPKEALALHLVHFDMDGYSPDDWIKEVAPHFNRIYDKMGSNKFNILDHLSHTDKAFQYRDQWAEAGIDYKFGALIYLLSYQYPYTLEVRQTSDGFVDPCKWVIEMFKEDKRIKQFVQEHNRKTRKVVLYWLSGEAQVVDAGLTETIKDVYTRLGYGAGAINALDFYDDAVENYDDPLTHEWVKGKLKEHNPPAQPVYFAGTWERKTPIIQTNQPS